MVREAMEKRVYEEMEKKVADIEKALLRAEIERDIYRECLMCETIGKCAALEDFGGEG